MKLTNRSEYALLALIYLSRYRSENFASIESIAAAQNIPHKYLEQILLTLKRARYVSSYKGQNGGYRLVKDPQEINLAEIIRLFDGALAPTESVSKYFYESTPIEKETKMILVLKDIRDYIAAKLEQTTLSDVT
jgi:Rrf2 family cysteine metabolism transcriptional repressor